MSFWVYNILKNHYHRLILAVVVVVFFLGTASFSYFTQKEDFVKWISPDETANYIFSKIYGQEKKLFIFEKYNLYVDDVIHPRSFRSDHGYLKPVSFLGMILIYGKIVSLTTYKILPFLTPFFGAVGLIFFYLLLEKIFGKKISLISTILLASFPVYIYYSARSMFHNILFLTFLIIGLYFSVLMTKRKKPVKECKNVIQVRDTKIRENFNLISSFAAGIFFGLAIITRTSELIWMLPLFVVLLIFNFKNISFLKLILIFSGLFLAVLPMFYWNQLLYGGALKGGYPEMNNSISVIAGTSVDMVKQTTIGDVGHIKELANKIKDNIFFFGFHPYDSVKKMYYYFADMFPWLFWPAIFGGILFFGYWQKVKRKHLVFLLSYVLVSVILLFYYGSWGFNDNPDPNSFTIGNSYTRYWLPIYLGALPFVSFFILKVTRLLRVNYLVISARFIIIVVMIFISTKFVLAGSEEGLIIAARKQNAWRDELVSVMKLTENNSVIITRYHDKLFFPERKVIVGLFDDNNMVSQYSKLVEYLPVYYYNFTFPPKDMDYLNDKRLPKYNLEILPVAEVTNDFTLYKLQKKYLEVLK